MGLNNSDHIINLISNMSDEQLKEMDLEVYLVSKASSTDELYNSKKEHLDSELRDWIKENIRNELNAIKFKDENDRKRFYVFGYDDELTKKDYVAELSLSENESLRSDKNKLLESLSSRSTIEDKEIKFQVIKVNYRDKEAYFIYYRGVKISSTQRRNVGRMPTIRHRDQLVIQSNDVVEFGGKIELMIVNEYFYIISPRTLEYAFNYTDNIAKRKERNVATITDMRFFKEDPNVDVFVEKSNQYMISRRLAGINHETLEALEQSFEERCRELKEIKENTPTDPDEKKEYVKKYEVLWPLYEHIDVFEKNVKINPDKSIEPLIYFFADKIVESFLTKELKEAL